MILSYFDIFRRVGLVLRALLELQLQGSCGCSGTRVRRAEQTQLA